MSLANNYLYEVPNEVLGIFRTNAMTLSPAEAALFPWVCRANHSCHPNCNYYHDPATGHQRLYCAAPVTRGQVGCLPRAVRPIGVVGKKSFIPYLLATHFQSQYQPPSYPPGGYPLPMYECVNCLGVGGAQLLVHGAPWRGAPPLPGRGQGCSTCAVTGRHAASRRRPPSLRRYYFIKSLCDLFCLRPTHL